MGKILLLLFVIISSQARADVSLSIDQIVKDYEINQRFYGNILVKQGDQVIYETSRGLANHAFEVPHTDKSRFMIASVSKQFTAAGILLLAQQGKINLDESLGQQLKIPRGAIAANQVSWKQITIRQLLNHTAGLYKDVRFTDNYKPEAYELSVHTIVQEQLSNYEMQIDKLIGKFHYSNFGYMLLAYLIESASRQYYDDFLRDNFFRPLGMQSSGEYHRMKAIKFMSEGLFYADGRTQLNRRCCRDASSFIGSHSLYSDVTDLMLWLEEISSDTPQVLNADSITTLKEIGIEVADNVGYGAGLFVDQVAGETRYWHDGFEYGFVSSVSFLPEQDLKIVILANRHTADVMMMGTSPTQDMSTEIAELILTSR